MSFDIIHRKDLGRRKPALQDVGIGQRTGKASAAFLGHK
jgi:hypothetical protein